MKVYKKTAFVYRDDNGTHLLVEGNEVARVRGVNNIAKVLAPDIQGFLARRVSEKTTKIQVTLTIIEEDNEHSDFER